MLLRQTSPEPGRLIRARARVSPTYAERRQRFLDDHPDRQRDHHRREGNGGGGGWPVVLRRWRSGRGWSSSGRWRSRVAVRVAVVAWAAAWAGPRTFNLDGSETTGEMGRGSSCARRRCPATARRWSSVEKRRSRDRKAKSPRLRLTSSRFQPMENADGCRVTAKARAARRTRRWFSNK
jgi:hypothetical protein